MEYIDAKGLICPMPVVKAKKALESPDVDTVQIKVDNFIAVQNLEKMAQGLGYEFSHKKVSDLEYEAVLAKSKSDTSRFESNNTDYTIKEIEQSLSGEYSDLVIMISCDTLGRGTADTQSDDLGRMLIKSFIYTLTELKNKPKVLLFLNSGVFLTTAASGALADLNALASGGVRILSCGACLNYYKLPEPVVGEITNMLEIVTIMTETNHLITL